MEKKKGVRSGVLLGLGLGGLLTLGFLYYVPDPQKISRNLYDSNLVYVDRTSVYETVYIADLNHDGKENLKKVSFVNGAGTMMNYVIFNNPSDYNLLYNSFNCNFELSDTFKRCDIPLLRGDQDMFLVRSLDGRFRDVVKRYDLQND